MAVYVLNDGIKIHTSTQGRSGLLGATFSDKWAMGTWDKLFSACTTQPSDLKVFNRLKAQKRTSLHLGKYVDSREAAYVIARYKLNPIAVIDLVQDQQKINGADAGVPADFFPADLYVTVPVFFTPEQALAAVKKYRGIITPVPVDKQKLVATDRSRLKSVYGDNVFMALGNLYGRDMVMRDMNNLYDDEFINRYGLDEETV